MFADPALRVIPSPPREDLDAELATCWRLVHAAEYVELGERLPQLISSRGLAARDPAGSPLSLPPPPFLERSRPGDGLILSARGEEHQWFQTRPTKSFLAVAVLDGDIGASSGGVGRRGGCVRHARPRAGCRVPGAGCRVPGAGRLAAVGAGYLPQTRRYRRRLPSQDRAHPPPRLFRDHA